MITVVLAGIENPGNLGAIARVMKNFGLTRHGHFTEFLMTTSLKQLRKEL